MKRILYLLLPLILVGVLTACGSGVPNTSSGRSDLPENSETSIVESSKIISEGEEDLSMKISVSANGNTIIYELNDNQAARDLYAQLPLTLTVEDFSTNEKVFYPPEKLGTAETPLANAGSGTLAYYSPWGDVVMFYDSYSSNGSLYELGRVMSGEVFIKDLSGTIQIAVE